jgi:hypothetical protein
MTCFYVAKTLAVLLFMPPREKMRGWKERLLLGQWPIG